MRLTRPRLAPSSRFRRRQSARFRLTALCGGLFLVSGAALLAATYVLFERATIFRTPHLPKVPHTPAIQDLQPPLSQALPHLIQAQHQLAISLPDLKTAYQGVGPGALVRALPQFQQAQRQFSRAAQQLAEAVHQVAQAGTAEAAQRAADSHQLLVDSGVALAVVAVLALLAGWLIGGRMLRPIRTITRTARRISSSNLHERLALEGPSDELKELGDTLDDLFARLEAAFEAQRHFVANASHELRSPLTRERTLVQVALGDPSTSDVWRSTGEELLTSNREQETLIEALLTLASSEGGLEHRETVDLGAIARAALADRRDRGRPGLEIEINAEEASVDGDPRLLECLVSNLVDNALRHNVESGKVTLSTASREGRAVVAIRNTGPVINPAEIDRLFQPFQRLDPRRSQHADGHGLGLSIVRAIANAHGATLTADAAPEGGLAISVAFPAPDYAARESL